MIFFSASIYTIIFSVLANCYIFVKDDMRLLTVVICVFAFFNLTAGIFSAGAKGIRLRFLCHGNVMLTSFCLSLIVAVVLHIFMLFGAIECDKSTFTYSVIYCVICNAVIFWNGIITVYLASFQLGLKFRVIGIVCGLIPIVNLIVLGFIMKISYSEVLFEQKKEKLNKARKEDELCKTKYPILFVHGIFFRDNKYLNYWGRIPKELKKNGAVCFYGNHQSADSVANSARELSARIKEIIEETGCEKLNIIAHSKGGLDSRYAMEYLGMAEYVASITTVNTPHRGCIFAEWLMKTAPEEMKDTIARYYNKAAMLLGDHKPDFIAAVSDLCSEVCAEFDKNTPQPKGVYCRSIGSVMTNAKSGKFPVNLTYRFVKMFDGKNDGLVGVDSFEWGSEYTLLDISAKRGISHMDVIDMNRENIDGFDVREFYVDLVHDLKEKGF